MAIFIEKQPGPLTFYIVSYCFHAIMAQLSSYDTDYMAQNS